MGVGVWNFISQPWMQQRRRPEGPDFSWNKTSFLNRLFECCGLVDLIIGKDLKLPHVNEQRTPISEAKGHYKIKESVMKELSELYSSFRVVLGEGECFYRSFIYFLKDTTLEIFWRL
ncbi:hypothetical protein PAHAL_1G095500 [Panicum hallii]|uniref:Uncharacterized protein n=1 Tax=Panicum hallii TaxID=206008 RepID=A0A2S3GMM8_9POAL|nr:uncharacterized protein LOC112878322 [Panicum hallii]PAN04835.1 hypothetical protein PAHAL_1G095500 [Panicum hallii]